MTHCRYRMPTTGWFGIVFLLSRKQQGRKLQERGARMEWQFGPMIPIAKPFLDASEADAAREAVLSGWLSQGAQVGAFEREFAMLTGAGQACAVSNCTAALHLALLAAGVEPNDEVITSSHSFIATANSIRYCGAMPIFVDIEPTSLQSRSGLRR